MGWSLFPLYLFRICQGQCHFHFYWKSRISITAFQKINADQYRQLIFMEDVNNSSSLKHISSLRFSYKLQQLKTFAYTVHPCKLYNGLNHPHALNNLNLYITHNYRILSELAFSSIREQSRSGKSLVALSATYYHWTGPIASDEC